MDPGRSPRSGLRGYEGESRYPRAFCRQCGSPVPKLSRNGQFWVVPSGSLNMDPGIRPQGNIYWAEHAPWLVSFEEIQKHEAAWVGQ